MLKRSNFVNLQIKVANVYGLSTQKLTLGLKKERKLRKKERTKTLRNLANLLAKCIMKTRQLNQIEKERQGKKNEKRDREEENDIEREKG